MYIEISRWCRSYDTDDIETTAAYPILYRTVTVRSSVKRGAAPCSYTTGDVTLFKADSVVYSIHRLE